MKAIGCTLALLACLPYAAQGQVLYSETFDTNNSANWMDNTTGMGTNLTTGLPVPMDTSADFFFDYSSVGIPPAPNSSGGSTRGMKLQANLFSDAFGGFSVSPLNQNFTGDYVVSYYMWSNYQGPLAGTGNGTTNLSYGGILSSGTSSNFPGSADGVWFAYTGDGGSSADYRAYSSARPVSYQEPPVTDPLDANFCDCDEQADYFAGSRNNVADLYRLNLNPESDPTGSPGVGSVQAPAAMLDLFPDQTGFVNAGGPGFAWRLNEISKVGNIVTWSVDGTDLITVDTTTFPQGDETGLLGGKPLGGGNILFGHSDINGSSSTDLNAELLLFTLIDNIEVRAVAAGQDNADFDGVNGVDGKDFLIWQTGYGIDDGTALRADGDANNDRNVGDADFAVWENQFATVGGVASATPTPEPASWIAALGLTFANLLGARRRRC